MSSLGVALLGVYDASLFVLCLFGLRRLWILIQYHRLRREEPRPPDPAVWPFVTVQLPVFNEVHVVERLLAAVARLDYPRDRFEIQVLDDSTDETTALVARRVAALREAGLAAHHLHRPNRAGYKAGALAAGMRAARGELTAIFDADFVPQPDFLRRTVPYFADPRLAFVQGGWEHLNRDASLLTRVQAILLDAHVRFEHTVRSRAGYMVNFTGTGGVWRVRAIVEAGGWQHDTLIEDADLAYRAALAGFRGLHLPDLLVPCELPEDPSAWRSQQARWAKGGAQVLRKLMLRVLRSGAPLGAKIECFLHLGASQLHLLNLTLALLMIPSLWLRDGARSPALLVADALVFALNMLSVGAYFALSQRERPRPRRWLRELRILPSLMALGMGSSLSQSKAVIEGLLGGEAVFERTPKSGLGRLRRPTSSYAVKASPLIPCEALLASLYGAALVAAALERRWAALPFLALFFHGFAHVAVLSTWEVLRRRVARAPAIPSIEPAP